MVKEARATPASKRKPQLPPAPPKRKTHEQVHFRLLSVECCHHLLCWVNPRLPNYCPECGERIYPQVRSWITVEDVNARLTMEA